MDITNRRRKADTDQVKRLRAEVENELSAITPLDERTKDLITAEGFANYYLRMVPLFPTQLEAYERLEDFHINVMGRRRYSEFGSFRRVLTRYLKKCRRTV